MSSFEGPEHGFDDLNIPAGELGSLASEGMPDPTARQPAAVQEDTLVASPAQTPRGEGDGLLAQISKASPYTVMLAVSLAAILLAIFCLFREYGAYHYDRPANAAKSISAVWPPGGEAPTPHLAPSARWA